MGHSSRSGRLFRKRYTWLGSDAGCFAHCYIGLRGEGFMNYKVAEARLRQALIPLLVGGSNIQTQSLFAIIFGADR